MANEKRQCKKEETNKNDWGGAFLGLSPREGFRKKKARRLLRPNRTLPRKAAWGSGD